MRCNFKTILKALTDLARLLPGSGVTQSGRLLKKFVILQIWTKVLCQAAVIRDIQP